MVKEIKAEKEYLGGEKVQTIYFGGGTPSILEVSDLQFLISEFAAALPVAAMPK